ncbi:hypothetical protein KUTeg_006263 [Tegillarca granosa]|uniref:B box-type domain-containing protein n=1 Tax=Tegillarca granosa TaxID=220873 RepID=A0ABQ9FG32_TEGGR|nr:hypothetical protein KUTeg_006263 [Tegillarca granosa]
MTVTLDIRGNRTRKVWIDRVKYQLIIVSYDGSSDQYGQLMIRGSPVFTTLNKMATAEVPDAQWPVFLDLKCKICERNETETKCPTHATEDLIMHCNSCQVPICRDCITSGSHQNHEMVKIENAIHNKRNELSKLIKQFKEKSSKYAEIVNNIDKKSQEFSVSITQKINEVKARNNQLKAALDRIKSEYIKHLKDTDRGNQKSMTELKNGLQKEMTDLNQLIEQCEEKQRNENIGMVQFVTDVKKRFEKYRSRDLIDAACLPELIARPVVDQELKDIFGQLGSKTATTVNPPLPQNRNIPIATSVMNAQKVNTFTSDKTHVVTTGNDQAWLLNSGGRNITLVTSYGKVIQDINTDFGVYEAAVSASGDLFVTMCIGNKVKKLTSHETFTDIYTAADDYETRGITVTDTGHVLVGLCCYIYSKLVEITTSGEHIRTIQHDTVDNKLLFDSPRFICTNINGDIIVSDNRDKVVAVNKSGTKRFIYDGKERKLQKSFDPWYVVTDKYGNIMIADYHNSVVHVLNQDGKFIKYLITREHGCNKPIGMAIDFSDRLWVCNTGNKNVIIVRYPKKTYILNITIQLLNC